MAVSFFWISNLSARLDVWKTLKLHQLQQIMLVLFEIYIRKLVLRIESWFWYRRYEWNNRRAHFCNARNTMCGSVIPFIPSSNDQNQFSILKCIYKIYRNSSIYSEDMGGGDIFFFLHKSRVITLLFLKEISPFAIPYHSSPISMPTGMQSLKTIGPKKNLKLEPGNEALTDTQTVRRV